MTSSTFEILLNNKSSIKITLWGEQSDENSILKIDAAEAFENGEAEIQIKEGLSYEYQLESGYSFDSHELIKTSRSNSNSGRIVPNIYVGTISFDILNEERQKCGVLKLEVRSVKTDYRGDYRMMLEDITEKCTDLILQHSSPVTQLLETDFEQDPSTLYQRFAFIKSVLDSEEFKDAIHKIVINPVTKWMTVEAERDIRNLKRFDSNVMRQISGSSNRINIPEFHTLNQKGILRTLPQKINSYSKKESIDTPENKFVKYALESFLDLVGKIKIIVDTKTRLHSEAAILEDQLEQFLNHSVFKEVSRLNTLPLNSPVLQRKEGYREVFRAWLMFELAAKLVWHGGDDVYSAGKRDVAKLYEYWLFFKLLDIVNEIFNIKPKGLDQLITPINKNVIGGTLGLNLKGGKRIAIEGTYKNEIRNLKIEFSFNRSFSGKKEYPSGGSWTKDMRPDYTLSIWPEAISQEEAEREELIVHIHFDAKYKVENLKELFGDDPENDANEENIQNSLNKEKEEEAKGNFKRVDLLKMHAYKDAIRRTGGVYVLYPGKSNEPYSKKGFHEILPGLGAFAIRPDKANDGSLEVKQFLNEVVRHFLNRASQREKAAYRTYDIHKDSLSDEVHEPIPEAYGNNRSLMPDETFVLVAFYKSEEQLKWIEENGLYNLRTGSNRGSLNLDCGVTSVRYLLLHGNNETKTARLIKLNDKGPRIFSKQDMVLKNYPNPRGEFYLVYKIENEVEEEFKDKIWDITKLKNYQTGRGSGMPFSVTLSQLMKAIVKD
ncbi:DUF2357 domain-containing protein [Taibaiella lutea]|uniref:DUF2357 domain-containing protein n=1 Tax=Taibaiella lutea TaxID=2608001 RepID=A0A5M6CKL0_9BACT|nr:DUF2357 domain-containing protein [Taibaiella lutea]KAA5534512.1 DUF2357 domain-containing protein [Taibaiella lutea]